MTRRLTSSKSPVMRQPAAFLWPPPPAGYAAAGSVLVAAAAERLGDLGDVGAALRAQADAVDARRQLFEERHGLDLADRQRMVDNAVGVLFTGAGLVHHRAVHR